jgi:hypothetical protein
VVERGTREEAQRAAVGGGSSIGEGGIGGAWSSYGGGRSGTGCRIEGVGLRMEGAVVSRSEAARIVVLSSAPGMASSVHQGRTWWLTGRSPLALGHRRGGLFLFFLHWRLLAVVSSEGRGGTSGMVVVGGGSVKGVEGLEGAV